MGLRYIKCNSFLGCCNLNTGAAIIALLGLVKGIMVSFLMLFLWVESLKGVSDLPKAVCYNLAGGSPSVGFNFDNATQKFQNFTLAEPAVCENTNLLGVGYFITLVFVIAVTFSHIALFNGVNKQIAYLFKPCIYLYVAMLVLVAGLFIEFLVVTFIRDQSRVGELIFTGVEFVLLFYCYCIIASVYEDLKGYPSHRLRANV